MNVIIREYTEPDLPAMMEIWNEIVERGVAFPQIESLSRNEALHFFAEQSFTGVAVNEGLGEILGLYILHPNNIGRCGHLANASYAVKETARNLNIGEKMVKHSLVKAKELGFKILQFNAVVKTNASAIHLYEKLGFIKLGVIPGGFLLKDGTFEDIIPFYRAL
ncbi:MAG: GNAT family N-acetyltransferase [Sporomusaceae bacterium]|jgi:L-amino acid N-acyltransferase YncA|nr:GNAT family N-acetyltransferase [Sporomusaceae bacterium]